MRRARRPHAVNTRLTLACALAAEERAARAGGARAARVGLRAALPLPDGPLAAFGLAGALAPGLAPGAIVTATRVVDPEGAVLWEGEPLPVPGATQAVICAADRVIDRAAERRAIAERTGAVAVETESDVLARTGRLAGVVRAIADGPDRPVGRLARAATPSGGVRWSVVALAFATEPLVAARSAAAARRALAALEAAARALAAAGRV